MSEDFVSFDLAKKLKEKGFREEVNAYYGKWGKLFDVHPALDMNDCDYRASAPTISQVLKWLREEKNIDIEIHADVGMLGIKVYTPYICTYTEFRLDTSPDVVRYRQKKFNPNDRLPHEVIPAHIYFEKWEKAAVYSIQCVLDNLI